MRRTIVMLLFAVFLFAGCAKNKPQPHSLPYNGAALHNLKLGRSYQIEGRFELARDRFLQALATAQDEVLREILVQELEATDRLIASQR